MQLIACQLYPNKAIKKKKSMTLTLQELTAGKRGKEGADTKAVARSREVIMLEDEMGEGKARPGEGTAEPRPGQGAWLEPGPSSGQLGWRPAGW